jgi:MYXO-CTERM domain-containing protein
VCDGLDNDCDGIIDNGMFDEAGQPCLTDVLEELFGDLDPDEDLPGECQRGTLACVQGSTDDGDVTGEIGCIGAIEPTDEICDGKDNDCDGEADTPDPCPGESQCIAGRCTEPCTVMGEFVICPGGQVCNSDGFCVPKEQAGSGGTTGASGDAGATAGPDGVEGSAGSGADDAEGAAGSGVVDSETGGAPSRPDTSSAGHDSSNPAWDSDGDGKRDEYALATGGGGCGCRLGPAPDARGVTLGILLLGLLGRLKRRRRRTTRARRAAA